MNEEKDYEYILKRILEEAEVTALRDCTCEQCADVIEEGATCYRIGHSHFCSVECVEGD